MNKIESARTPQPKIPISYIENQTEKAREDFMKSMEPKMIIPKPMGKKPSICIRLRRFGDKWHNFFSIIAVIISIFALIISIFC